MGIGMVRSTFNLTSIYPNLSSKLRSREGKIEAFFLGFVSSYELKEPFGSKKKKESRRFTVSEILTLKNCCSFHCIHIVLFEFIFFFTLGVPLLNYGLLFSHTVRNEIYYIKVYFSTPCRKG